MGNLACKTKIIIDGDNIGGFIEGICAAAESLPAETFTDENSYPIIERMIKMEKLATECQDLMLDLVDYDGPRPRFFPKP